MVTENSLMKVNINSGPKYHHLYGKATGYRESELYSHAEIKLFFNSLSSINTPHHKQPLKCTFEIVPLYQSRPLRICQWDRHSRCMFKQECTATIVGRKKLSQDQKLAEKLSTQYSH